MTTLEHLNRKRKRHGLLSRKCLPHMFLVCQELLARHESTPAWPVPLVEENWHGTNLFHVERCYELKFDGASTPGCPILPVLCEG
jgi:hypothetical protein